MAANDYYDFNPSPGIWALMLSAMVLFVLAISVLLIYMVDRGQATGRTAEVGATDELATRHRDAVRSAEPPAVKAS